MDDFLSSALRPYMTSHVRSPGIGPSSDYYDPQLTSINDDDSFIDRAMNRGVQGETCLDPRASWLWGILTPNVCLESEREVIFLDLLANTSGDDIWLWQEGDARHPMLVESAVSAVPWTEAASALARYQFRSQSSPLRARIALVSPEARLATIAWLVLTSSTLRKADTARGFSERGRWDFRGLLNEWSRIIGPEISAQLESHMLSPEFFSMHLLHWHNSSQRAWLYIQAALSPREQQTNLAAAECRLCCFLSDLRLGKPVAHGLDFAEPASRPEMDPDGHHSSDSRSVDDKPASGPVPPPTNLSGNVPASVNEADYEPAPVLIVLHHLYRIVRPHGIRFIDYLQGAQDQQSDILHRIFRGSRLVEDWLHQQRPEPPDVQYLPWVNKYPARLRFSITSLTTEEWRNAELLLSWSKPWISSPPHLEDFATWICGVIFSMGKVTLPLDRMAPWFMKTITNPQLRANFPIMPAETLYILHFRGLCQDSYHTCWERWGKLGDCYAAALEFLGLPLTFVGIGHPDTAPPCFFCHLINGLGTEFELEPDEDRINYLGAVLRTLKHVCSDHGFLGDLISAMDEVQEELGEQEMTVYNPSDSRQKSYQESPTPRQRSLPLEIVLEPVDSHSRESSVAQDFHDRPAASSSTDHENQNIDNLINMPSEPEPASLQIQTTSSLPTVPKGTMIRKIKNFLISALESQEVPLEEILGKPKLPWTSLTHTLERSNVEMLNWPSEVPLPGTGNNDNKGINGLSSKYLRLLYAAIHDRKAPLMFRRMKRRRETSQGAGCESQEGERAAKRFKTRWIHCG
ncbi:hypothetical protein C8J56DRAFT_940821 [Mycena floridula]|nr:hypothetical protein C8J56DRAFT_940821 [Mycena floridula]